MRPILRRLCVTVLIFEAVVLGLSIPVAIQISHLAPGAAGTAGGIAAGAAIVLAGLARRRLTVTLVGGSVLQVYAIASGAIVPVMYFLGGIFALLWFTGLWLANRLEGSPQP